MSKKADHKMRDSGIQDENDNLQTAVLFFRTGCG